MMRQPSLVDVQVPSVRVLNLRVLNQGLHATRWVRMALALVASALVLSGCASLPRGAAVATEITSGATGTAETGDFVVYPVTRAFLPQVAYWPITGEHPKHWLSHSHGSRSRVLRPGDSVQLVIWDASENSLLSVGGARFTPLPDLRVSPSGSIFVPYAGNVQIAGNTPEAARSIVQRAITDFVPSAEVQLSMNEGTANTVSLVGGAAAPGRYPLPDNTFSVLDLLAQGGGINTALNNPQIKLHRGHKLFSISAATLYKEPKRDAPLRPGDQVIIEQDPRYFLSLGASGSETQHPFTKDFLSAADAVAIAGGVNDGRADPGGILILREYPSAALRPGTQGPQKKRVVFTIDLTTADGLFSARQFRINSEDLIYVTESPVTRTATILSLVGSGFGLVNTLNAASGSSGN